MKTTYKKSSKKSGFSLVELLVVIAIISILSSVVFASLNSARAKGRDGKRVSDLKQLQLALELYYDAAAPASFPSGTSLSGLAPTYIQSIPVDPMNTAPYQYTYQAVNSSGAACSSGTCSSYVLKGSLESKNSALDGDYDTDSAGVDCDPSDTAASGPYTLCFRP